MHQFYHYFIREPELTSCPPDSKWWYFIDPRITCWTALCNH